VRKNLGIYAKEAQGSCNAFVKASILPWIPIIPDKSTKLDKEREKNYYGLNLGRSVTS